MSSTSPQSFLVVHPTFAYLAVITVLALFALQTAPSFVPLVLLLATLRLFITVVYPRHHAWIKIPLSVILLAASATAANIGTSLHAIPEVHSSSAVAALYLLKFINSTLIVGAVTLDRLLSRSSHHNWAHYILFPTVWTTVFLIISAASPLGYLTTWSPIRGIGAYSWLRPITGPPGIDWIVGAWAVVLSELAGAWIVGPTNGMEDPLVSTRSRNGEDHPRGLHGAPWLFSMLGLLCIATLPSYFQNPLPTPVNSEFTTPLPVACALPYVENSKRRPSFDEYLKESTILTSLAKVVLWPEGAVHFESEVVKQEAIEKVAISAAGSVVGVSFEEHVNGTKENEKIRNGFMLVDKDGLVFEYFKKHLVPFVESNTMVSSSAPPEIFDYQLITNRNSRGKATEFLSVPITVSICLDFAHPMPFSKLNRRPSLILGPAHTWHPIIGAAMWEQAKARAKEVGSAVLWCDGGEEGISGVGGQGLGGGEVVQVGPGSWVRTIGVNSSGPGNRTVYTHIGQWLSVLFIWLIFGTEKGFEMCVRRARSSQSEHMSFSGLGLKRQVMDSFRAWKRRRQVEDVGERAHLLETN